jgi:hypothetical protein
MSLKTKVSGTWKTGTTSVKVSGTWRTVSVCWTRVGGVWKPDYSISVGINTTSLYGSDPTPVYSVTVGPATATPSGSPGTYSYAWELVSGSTFNLSAATSASTNFSWNNSSTVGSRSGVYRCKVTDSNGIDAYSPNVTITMDFGV